MKRTYAISLVLVGCLSSISTAQRGTSGTALQLPLRLNGAAVSAAGVGNPIGTAQVEIVVNRLSTAEERTQLLSAAKQGQRELLEALQDARSVGTIQFHTQLAWDLRYAEQTSGEDGAIELALATDRPMSAAEIWNNPRYSDYPFTLINVNVDPQRGGEGSMILAAQIRPDSKGRFIHVENFASTPVRLNNLKVAPGR